MKKILNGILLAFVIMLFISNCLADSLNKKLNLEFTSAPICGKILYVGGSGPGNYTKIQDAIDDASNGDTIFVYNGAYLENVVLNKTINLVGEDKNTTIIDGNYGEKIIHLTTDEIDIVNFKIKNSGGEPENAGIEIESNGNSIMECIICRTNTGIRIDGKSNLIRNCSFHANGEGILLKSSSNRVLGCCFCHNAIGINLQQAANNFIKDIDAHTNGIALFFNESFHNDVSRCNIHDNNDNQGGIFIGSSRYINISKCNISHNGFGIRFIDSSHIHLSRCKMCRNMHNGLSIENSSEITISNCELANSLRYGIHMRDSSFISIKYNNIYNSTLYGIYAESTFSNARHNWWGSPIGPSGRAIGFGDKVMWKKGCVFYFPWLSHPINPPELHLKTGNGYREEHHHPILPGKDTDGDGVPDWWEEKWGYDPYRWNDHRHLDPDKDGLNNIEECFTDKWNSNPFYKDIFLEFDWMENKEFNESNQLPPWKIKQLVRAFEEYDIALHVDNGQYGGGEEIPFDDELSYPEVRDVYWNYFLHNELNNPRKGIFHYALLSNRAPYDGFSFMGWDQLDSFVLSCQNYRDMLPQKFATHAMTTCSMHELGHTLGLFIDDFGGIDNDGTIRPWRKGWWTYRNYKSCLNYRYAWIIMDYSDGTHGKNDFDDWGNLDLSFFKNSSWS